MPLSYCQMNLSIIVAQWTVNYKKKLKLTTPELTKFLGQILSFKLSSEQTRIKHYFPVIYILKNRVEFQVAIKILLIKKKEENAKIRLIKKL